jgi:pyruvate formate lyase activating enzyme
MSCENFFIADFIPVSLIDYPGEVAATVFTHGCNLRCRYCHNSLLVTGRRGVNKSPEFFSYMAMRKIGAAAITGGEPLFSENIEYFVSRLKNDGIKVKLDTNGFSPSRLKSLLDRRLLDYVAVDIKGFCAEDIQYMTRTAKSSEPFVETLRMLKGAGVAFELRYTAWKFPETESLVWLSDYACDVPVALQFLKRDTPLLDKRFMPPLGKSEFLKLKALFDAYFAKVLVRE